jgi:undecaprenyl-phosphate glucose phosphotransferase
VSNLSVFNFNSRSKSEIARFLDLSILIGTFFLTALIYDIQLNREYLIVLLVIISAFLYFAEGVSLYRSWRVSNFRAMIFSAWLVLLVSFFSLFLFAFVFNFSEQLSRVVVALWFTLAFVSFFCWRFILRSFKRNRRKLGLSSKKVAIIGATKAGFAIAENIKKYDELGYENIGFFEDRMSERVSKKYNINLQGSINRAVERARSGEIDILFIALPLKAEKRIADILALLGDTTVDVHFIHNFFLSNLIHARLDHVGDIDTLSLFESPYFGGHQLIKRAEDFVIGSIILLAITPLLLLISLGIKFTSKGPVLFKQDRYGLAGQNIKVWKFRSMKVMENNNIVTQATKNDTRITPFGRFLRRTSLDELPQFFNVLMGDMSIVGPRPHAVAHNEEYRKKVEFYMLRHKVKPGITGWAQINGWRGETDTLLKMEKRIEFDLQYLKHWSLWFDIKIIFLTILKGFSGKNAY